MYAVIRLRGSVNLRREVRTTLEKLRLSRANHCVLLQKTPSIDGMLKISESYLTWGEVEDGVLEQVLKKRGRLAGDKRPTEQQIKEALQHLKKNGTMNGLQIKPVLRLTPPSKGLRSLKLRFPRGDCGYRGKEINELLQRML